MNLGAGANSHQMNLLLNSEELTMALFTNDCKNSTVGSVCDVPDPYTPVFNGGHIMNLTSEMAFLYQKNVSNPGGISQVQLHGMEGSNAFNISVASYLRQFIYTGYVFEVMQVN